ncbi:MAG: hypothetical protein HFI11_01670 [Lachnospiraceae bacterium]|nr:hypothetical protein [Lachnospiraceae bacterium]
MKLRYYLRGLGIGMLVAALVLILSGNTGGKMSDEAVRNRAAQLGMVEKDKTVLEDIVNEASGEQSGDAELNKETEDAAVSEEEKDGTAAADAAPEGEAPEVPDEVSPEEGENAAAESADAETEADGAAEDEQTLADQIEQRADEVADRAKEVAENSIPEKIVTFEVYQGDTSVSVSRRAKEMGLVESAADFDVFLCRNGYDKRISIGTYEITIGATEKEIADIVTKSR